MLKAPRAIGEQSVASARAQDITGYTPKSAPWVGIAHQRRFALTLHALMQRVRQSHLALAAGITEAHSRTSSVKTGDTPACLEPNS